MITSQGLRQHLTTNRYHTVAGQSDERALWSSKTAHYKEHFFGYCMK